jgi:hypothetical protein
MDALTRGETGWDLYSSTGLRNVLYGDEGALVEERGPYPKLQGDFEHAVHAWPRPAWYTLRRLAWLLARAQRVKRVHESPDCGAMAVLLVAREGFATPSAILSAELGGARARPCRYAYVAWLDGTKAAAAGATAWVIELRIPSWSVRGDWSVLPLVPVVECGSVPPIDSYGFAGAATVDWDATPRTSTVSERWTLGAHFIDIVVTPSEPGTNPAPICVLCDHEVVGMSLRWTSPVTGVAERAPIEIEGIGGASVAEAPRDPIRRAPKRTG